MRRLVSLARRRFAVGGLVLAGWGLLRDLAGARRAQARGLQPSKPGPGELQPKAAPPTLRAPAFRVKVKGFEVGGGTKPGDTVTLRLTVATTGGGTRNVPWRIARDNDVVLRAETRTGVAAGTTFEVTASWVATGGAHEFYAEVDRDNSLAEPPAERADNVSPRTTRVFADWPGWLARARTATKAAVATWKDSAMLVGVRVDGPIANGGQVTGPPLGPLLLAALSASSMPPAVASGFSAAVGDAWRAWTDSIRVPALPWYPPFAAWPAAQAPPTPNVPTPLAALAQTRASLSESALAAGIKGRVGPAKDWPGASGIDAYAGWLARSVDAAVAATMVTNVTGSGPVPSFAPPYVPVGPVAGGQASGRAFATFPPFQ
jgi:hypothetical protein